MRCQCVISSCLAALLLHGTEVGCYGSAGYSTVSTLHPLNSAAAPPVVSRCPQAAPQSNSIPSSTLLFIHSLSRPTNRPSANGRPFPLSFISLSRFGASVLPWSPSSFHSSASPSRSISDHPLLARLRYAPPLNRQIVARARTVPQTSTPEPSSSLKLRDPLTSSALSSALFCGCPPASSPVATSRNPWLLNLRPPFLLSRSTSVHSHLIYRSRRQRRRFTTKSSLLMISFTITAL